MVLMSGEVVYRLSITILFAKDLRYLYLITVSTIALFDCTAQPTSSYSMLLMFF
jgi:hypothetical protein